MERRENRNYGAGLSVKSRRMTFLLIWALLFRTEECDDVHGVGCIRSDSGTCGGCRGEIDPAFRLCADCASKEGRCVCGQKKRVHAVVGVLGSEAARIRLVAGRDVYREAVEAVAKHFPDRRDRGDGQVEYDVVSGVDCAKGDRVVYARFVKIDVAGGPAGKYERAILSRRIRILSWTTPDVGKGLTITVAKGRRAVLSEPECKACGLADRVEGVSGEHLSPLEVPAVGTDHGFEVRVTAEGKTVRVARLLYKDGAWRLDGEPVLEPLVF